MVKLKFFNKCVSTLGAAMKCDCELSELNSDFFFKLGFKIKIEISSASDVSIAHVRYGSC